MKKLTFITASLGIILILITVFFKAHHLAGAGYLLLYGTLFIAVIVLPLSFIYIMKAVTNEKNLLLYGVASAFLLLIGLLFKFLHWPGSIHIHGLGTLLLIIIVILYASRLFKREL